MELTRLSSKGQIVIPQHIREALSLKEGEAFVIVGKDDTILLKKLSIPSKKELFESVHSWGVKFAKRKGFKEEKLQEQIERARSN